MKRMAMIGVIFLSAVALAGCPTYVYPDSGGGGEGNDGGSYYNNVVVYNETYAEYIVGVYLSPTLSNDWGYNQLDYVLAPGDGLNINSVLDDCYDLYAEADSGTYWEVYDICVYGGETYELSLSG